MDYKMRRPGSGRNTGQIETRSSHQRTKEALMKAQEAGKRSWSWHQAVQQQE